MGFPRQEYWSGLPWPPPGDLPDPGIEPRSPASPALQEDSLPAEPSGHLREGVISCPDSSGADVLAQKELSALSMVTCKVLNAWGGSQVSGFPIKCLFYFLA